MLFLSGFLIVCVVVQATPTSEYSYDPSTGSCFLGSLDAPRADVTPSLCGHPQSKKSVIAPHNNNSEVKHHELRTHNIVFDNGNFVTSPGVSAVVGLGSLGVTFQCGVAVVADDFTLSAATLVDTITVYGYQTNSGTTSTFTELRIQIITGTPNSPTVVFGDLTTNVLASTSFTGIYRYNDGFPDTDRPIMEIVGNVNVFLPAGTYWIIYCADGSGTTPFANPIPTHLQLGNAEQSMASESFKPFIEAGTLRQAGLPFLVSGDVPVVTTE